VTEPTFLSAPQPTGAHSPFAGADLCHLMGFALPVGAPRPRFEDDRWDFCQVIGLPAYLPKCARRLEFSGILNPRWKMVAKEYIAASMAPGHQAVRMLPHANRTPKAVNTSYVELLELVRWLNWLTRQGVNDLGQVTEHHCLSFAGHRATHKPDGTATPHRKNVYKQVANAVLGLVQYGELFSTERLREGLRPFAGHSASAAAGISNSISENKTQPVPAHIFQPLLAAALYLVQTVGPHLVAEYESKHEQDAARVQYPRNRAMPHSALQAALRRHLDQGRPLERVYSTKTRGDAWGTAANQDDPLSAVNLRAIAYQVGRGEFHPSWLPLMRPQIEEVLAAVGVENPYCREAALVERADGQGTAPWSAPLPERDLRILRAVVKTASHLVIVALSGMRHSELREMNVGCRVPAVELGPGLVRYKLASRVVKHKPLGGVADEWVVVKEAYQAAGIAEQLLGPAADIGDPLVTGNLDKDRYETFRHWVNSNAGGALGLAPIPPGSVALKMLRRKLALEIAYRPGGLLAAKVQLKHLSVVTTEGYAARPGGAQARFLAEVNQEESERNTGLVLAEFRSYQQGRMPAGPGARDLVDFFASVDGQLVRGAKEDPSVVGGDQEVCALLSTRAKVLHLGTANYCWFIDPAKALCLKLAGTPNATEPLAGMCDSSRCPQATHHPCHRPVWESSARTKQVFIGSIGRNHKAEKDRLKAGLDRDLRVLASIATTTTTGTEN
jgi:hypothetical protein